MATFANSFALLEGDGPSSSSGTSKNKKSKKNKKPPASALPPANGPAAAPRSADNTPADDGFKVAGKTSKRNSAEKTTPPVVNQRNLVESIAALETKAWETPYRARAAQYDFWRRQVTENDLETFSDGTNTYSYKEMFLTSEALDVCAQVCLKPPFPTKSDLQAFGHLLAACLPPSVLNEQVQALLLCIEHLGSVTATFGGKSDLEKQAQQAVCAAIACLKEPQGQPEPSSSTPSVNSEVLDLASNQAHDLEQLAKKIGDPSSWRGNKDAVQHALKLATEHLELFSDRRGGAPPNSKAAQAVAALDALLQDIPVRDEMSPDGPDDDMHRQQLDAIRVKIRECEEVLAVLRQQERSHLGRSPHPLGKVVLGQALPEQLESLETLKEYMISSKGPNRDPSGLSASGMSEGQLSEAVQYFLTNLERMLHSNRIAAEETGAKMQETAVKLASAVKTGRTLQMLEGMKQEDVAKNRVHQQNYEKQLKGLVASIEGTMRESREGMKGLEKYKAQLFRVWPKEDVQSWLASFSKCMQETQVAHAAALDAAKNKGQAPGQRPPAPVSLSHADPVVQPNQSSAGAVGRSAVPS